MTDRWPVSPSAVALDLIEPDEQALVDELLAGDADFASAVQQQRALSGSLMSMPADMRRPAAPPPLRPAAGAKSNRTPRFSMPSFRSMGVLAGAIAAVALAVVVVSGNNDPSPAPQQASATVVLKPITGGGPARAKLTVTGSSAKLVGSNLPPTPAGKHYEAWLARNDGQMTPMGGFKVDQSGSVKAGMPFNEDLSQFDYIDVSVEPDGGPTQHSGNSVLRAPLTS